MAIIRRQIAGHVLEEYAKHGMLAEIAELSAAADLAILAKPDLGRERLLRMRHSVRAETMPSHWYYCWWAKLLRKLYQKRLGFFGIYKKQLSWLRRWTKFPHWLVELIFANQIKLVYGTEPWPDDSFERIQVMRHYLLNQGKKPAKVVVGQKALYELWRGAGGKFGFGCWNPIDLVLGNKCVVFGLEIEVNPFLAEDEILVV